MQRTGRPHRGSLSSASTARACAAVAALAGVASGLCSCVRTGDRETAEALQEVAAQNETSQAYREVDPELVRYSQVQEIDTGLDEPKGIAIGPDGALYVAGDQEIRIFGPDGALQSRLLLGDTPHCVAVDESGSIFVGYRQHVRIHDLSGGVQAEWAVTGENPYLTCVTLSGKDVWIADAGDRVVLRYDQSGRLRGRLGDPDDGKGVPGLVIPSYHLDVAVGPGGLLLVNNPGRLALETYTSEGDMTSSWSKASMEIEGFCGCCNPTDIAVLGDGRVVTSEKGIPRVKILERDGTLSCVVAAPESLSTTASGIDLAVDAEGRILALDPPARSVRVFAEKEAGTRAIASTDTQEAVR